ncbi:MAG: arylsulfatase [Pedosphaera sp.]|nr:arylsulfatase [Pedosphaera sp.]
MSRISIVQLLILCLLGVPWFGHAADARRPNILLVMTDDQGYGEMSCHGNPILRTPNLDRLHARSVRFTDFHVSPTCSPTRAALLTGRHEFRSGVTHTIFERERLGLSATTMPEVLRSAGYSTGIFGKWHLGDEEPYQPHRRGFDEVFIHGGGGIGQTYPGSCGDVPGNTYRDPVIRHNGRFVRTEGYCTDVFIEQASRWINDCRRKDRPFFAYITPNVPHGPFISPGSEWEAPYLNRGLSTDIVRYYAMIAHFDAALGRLLDRLTEWKLEQETLVIFMTDNGHSVPGIFNAGMRGMKGTAYQGGTRVPSFWSWPGKFPEGVDVNRLTAHLDVFPTLVELSGGKVPRQVRRDWEGRNLLPLLKNPNARWPDRMLFTHFGRWESGQAEAHKFKVCAVRNQRFRLVNDVELYDIQADPGETINVTAQHPMEAARLRAAYARWWKDALPSALASEWDRGPEINPFKQLYWEELGGAADEAIRQRMNPDHKFNPKRPPL